MITIQQQSYRLAEHNSTAMLPPASILNLFEFQDFSDLGKISDPLQQDASNTHIYNRAYKTELFRMTRGYGIVNNRQFEPYN